MKEYTIEWDVELWTYVLIYKDVKYPLNVNSIVDAETNAKIKIPYLKRLEEQHQVDCE
jgi:hypothetical protein